MRGLLILLIAAAACDVTPPNQFDGGVHSCPDMAGDGGLCLAEGQGCTDSTRTCDCHGRVWYCRSLECPPPGGPFYGCSMPGLICDYGLGDSCTCMAGSQWACACGPFCPTTPRPQSPCCQDGLECDYTSTTTGRVVEACMCLTGFWACNP